MRSGLLLCMQGRLLTLMLNSGRAPGSRRPRRSCRHQRDIYIHCEHIYTLCHRITATNCVLLQVHGALYGTRRADVEAALAAGKVAVLDIDVQGARQVGIVPTLLLQL